MVSYLSLPAGTKRSIFCRFFLNLTVNQVACLRFVGNSPLEIHDPVRPYHPSIKNTPSCCILHSVEQTFSDSIFPKKFNIGKEMLKFSTFQHSSVEIFNTPKKNYPVVPIICPQIFPISFRQRCEMRVESVSRSQSPSQSLKSVSQSSTINLLSIFNLVKDDAVRKFSTRDSSAPRTLVTSQYTKNQSQSQTKKSRSTQGRLLYASPKTVHDIFKDIRSPDLGDMRIKNPKATYLLLTLRFMKECPK